MKFINRSVLVIKPKQPYLDWTGRVSPDGIRLKPEDVQQDCTTYLLSEPLDRRQLGSFLQTHYSILFEHELRSWEPNEGKWPTDRSYESFRQWFDVELHSAVIDMLDPQPLQPATHNSQLKK
ncbi:MAG: hypothetical protein ACP5HM_03010 [Anaerolineae bacterium]